jgi:signal transduction histidine kinase
VELRCTATGDVAVVADAGRLAQATGNLLANALEHGRGDVEVSVCVRHGRARVEVSDHGGGLREPLPAPSRGRGQRGRGLAIAAAIAARHGGRLAAAPAVGGTTVALELPLAPVAARRARTG